MEEKDSAKDNRPDESKPKGKPAGKRGHIVPAGTLLGRKGITVMTVGPAQLEAIKRSRAKEKRGSEEGASGKQGIQPPEERPDSA